MQSVSAGNLNIILLLTNVANWVGEFQVDFLWATIKCSLRRFREAAQSEPQKKQLDMCGLRQPPYLLSNCCACVCECVLSDHVTVIIIVNELFGGESEWTLTLRSNNKNHFYCSIYSNYGNSPYINVTNLTNFPVGQQEKKEEKEAEQEQELSKREDLRPTLSPPRKWC